MKSPDHRETLADPDEIDTVPANEVPTQASLPVPENAWDSEAPTSVHARKPLFARPPRLPSR
ncbi:MAG TPA: hypothetical protein VHV51_01950 [Polyangiaceae bacterium]|jgi:hypothetical protein|nr:hypothetical protein [Polyangiaceae bacterium]